jgi:hypothetical protein
MREGTDRAQENGVRSWPMTDHPAPEAMLLCDYPDSPDRIRPVRMMKTVRIGDLCHDTCRMDFPAVYCSDPDVLRRWEMHIWYRPALCSRGIAAATSAEGPVDSKRAARLWRMSDNKALAHGFARRGELFYPVGVCAQQPMQE